MPEKIREHAICNGKISCPHNQKVCVLWLNAMQWNSTETKIKELAYFEELAKTDLNKLQRECRKANPWGNIV